METEISTASDMMSFLEPAYIAAGLRPTPADVETATKLIEPDRAHVVYAAGQVVGAAGAYSHELAVPLGVVRAAGVCQVAVLPTHRRRGILSKLMQAQLADIHRRGEAVACLWTSEEPIYRRFGYGMASQRISVEIDATAARKMRNAPERQGKVRLIERERAYDEIAPIYARIWQKHPGMFFRSEDWWRCSRLPDQGQFQAVWEDSAYALYRINLTGIDSGELRVVEALADSVEGTREIWRFLLEIDRIKVISAFSLPVDHPLILMLEEPRKMNMRIADSLWIRIVDLKAALNGRALGEGSVLVQITDSLLPHNEGVWKIGREGVVRVSTAPEILVDISDLGSVYLSGFTFTELAGAGRAQERVPGAIRRADRVFSWDCKPWCPELF